MCVLCDATSPLSLSPPCSEHGAPMSTRRRSGRSAAQESTTPRGPPHPADMHPVQQQTQTQQQQWQQPHATVAPSPSPSPSVTPPAADVQSLLPHALSWPSRLTSHAQFATTTAAAPMHWPLSSLPPLDTTSSSPSSSLPHSLHVMPLLHRQLSWAPSTHRSQLATAHAHMQRHSDGWTTAHAQMHTLSEMHAQVYPPYYFHSMVPPRSSQPQQLGLSPTHPVTPPGGWSAACTPTSTAAAPTEPTLNPCADASLPLSHPHALSVASSTAPLTGAASSATQCQPSQPSAASTRSRRSAKAVSSISGAPAPVRASTRTRTPVSSSITSAASPARGLRRSPTKQQQRRQASRNKAAPKARDDVVTQTPSRVNSTASSSPSSPAPPPPIKCQWGPIMYWGQYHRPASVFSAPATPELHAERKTLIQKRFFLLRTVNLLGEIALVLKDLMDLYEKRSTGGLSNEFHGSVKAQVSGAKHPLICLVLPLSALGVHVTSLAQPGKNKYNRVLNAAARQWITRVHHIMTLPHDAPSEGRAISSTFDENEKAMRVGSDVVRPSPQQIARRSAMAKKQQSSANKKAKHKSSSTAQSIVMASHASASSCATEQAEVAAAAETWHSQSRLQAAAVSQIQATRSHKKVTRNGGTGAGRSTQFGTTASSVAAAAATATAAPTRSLSSIGPSATTPGWLDVASSFSHRFYPRSTSLVPLVSAPSSHLPLVGRGTTALSVDENSVRAGAEGDAGSDSDTCAGADTPNVVSEMSVDRAQVQVSVQLQSLMQTQLPTAATVNVDTLFTQDQRAFSQQFSTSMPMMTHTAASSATATAAAAAATIGPHGMLLPSATGCSDLGANFAHYANGPQCDSSRQHTLAVPLCFSPTGAAHTDSERCFPRRSAHADEPAPWWSTAPTATRPTAGSPTHDCSGDTSLHLQQTIAIAGTDAFFTPS